MPNNQGIDKALLSTLKSLEKSVNSELEVLSNQLLKELKKASSGNKVTKIKSFETRSSAIIDAYFDGYAGEVAKSSGAVASYKAGLALKELKPILAKNGYTNTFKRMKEKQAGYDVYYQALLNKRRVKEFGNYTFTERIKTLKSGTTKVVRAIVKTEVEKGTGALEIAKKIDSYVLPADNPRLLPRETVKNAKGISVRGVPSGSVQYNAIRIARTETAYSYRQATVDYYKDEEFIKGYEWVLSNRHDQVDICNEWASKPLYKKDGSDLPAGHPNCICDTRSVLVSDKKLKELGLE